MKHPNRESWLQFLTDELKPVFAAVGAPLPPKIRIAIGFTSSGDRGKSIGECWDSTASADDHFEILIRPDTDDPNKLAHILAHELVHAAVGIRVGHKGAFRTVALAIGLVGPMRMTVAGPIFETTIAPILKKAGPVPHARLVFRRTRVQPESRPAPGAPDDGSGADPDDDSGKDEDVLTTRPRRQVSRMIKCACGQCGYTVRTARKWLEQIGPPHCPDHGAMEYDHGVLEAAD